MVGGKIKIHGQKRIGKIVTSQYSESRRFDYMDSAIYLLPKFQVPTAKMGNHPSSDNIFMFPIVAIQL